MSTRATIFLTKESEHCYIDSSEPLTDKNGERQDAISIEFSKTNIRIDLDDEWDLAITIVNPDCDLYKIFKDLKSQFKP